MECYCSETGRRYDIELSRFELALRNILGKPESTATSPPSSTSSGPSKTTNGSNEGSGNESHHNMTGPVVGGKRDTAQYLDLP